MGAMFNKNGILGVTLLLFLFIVLPIVSLIVVTWYNFVHTYMKFEYIVSILWRTLVCGICMISFVIEYAEMLGRYNHQGCRGHIISVDHSLHVFCNFRGRHFT